MNEDERLAGMSIIAISGIVVVFIVVVLLIRSSPSTSSSEGLVGSAAELAVKGGPGGKNTCTDTDHGKDYLAAGMVTGINDNKYFKEADLCIKMDVLKEHYCEEQGSENFVKYVYVNCPGVFGGKSLCREGKCI